MTTSHQLTSTNGSETCKTMEGGEVKFNKFNVSCGSLKARVFYSMDNRIDGRKCVTLYAKDYGHVLGLVLKDVYVNNTDLETDYFDEGRAVLFESHPLYGAARARAEIK